MTSFTREQAREGLGAVARPNLSSTLGPCAIRELSAPATFEETMGSEGTVSIESAIANFCPKLAFSEAQPRALPSLFYTSSQLRAPRHIHPAPCPSLDLSADSASQRDLRNRGIRGSPQISRISGRLTRRESHAEALRSQRRAAPVATRFDGESANPRNSRTGDRESRGNTWYPVF